MAEHLLSAFNLKEKLGSQYFVYLYFTGATHTWLFSTTDAVVADSTKRWLMFAADEEGGSTQSQRAAMSKEQAQGTPLTLEKEWTNGVLHGVNKHEVLKIFAL